MSQVNGSSPTMENLYYEIALEHLFQMPYAEILRGTREGGAQEMDLLQMGHRVYLDMVRVANRQLLKLSIPARFPRPGEYLMRRAA